MYIASNFDGSRRGSQTQDYRQVSSAKISYRCTVSQVFLELVVAPGNLDELLIGRYKVLEVKQCDVLREYGPRTGDVQKIDPTIVLVIHTCRRHRKWQSKSPSKIIAENTTSEPKGDNHKKERQHLFGILTDISLQIEQPVNPRRRRCPVTL